MERKSSRKRCLQAVREIMNRTDMDDHWKDVRLQVVSARYPTTYSDAVVKVKAEQYKACGGTPVSPPLPEEQA
jgi:hypothetical protein